MVSAKKVETIKVQKTAKSAEISPAKEKTVKKVATAEKKATKETKVDTKAETKKAVSEKISKKSGKNTTYATGKRKNAIAKVWISEGNGTFIINGKPANEYLKRAILDVIINQPFQKTETEGKFDINCTVLGGGLSGQAGAIKHAISIALQLLNPQLRGVLKSAGFLTRDSRIVERKKAGLKKARKGQVYQKR